MKLSIISPVYKGEKMLDELVSRIEASVETFTKDFDIIYLNDFTSNNNRGKIQKHTKHYN